MDPLIENLKSTTFFGKRLTRRQIADIQETVGLFPKLSRTELGHTICEHLRWQTPKGSNRIHLATRLLGVSTKFRTIWAVAAMAVEWSRRSSALHDC